MSEHQQQVTVMQWAALMVNKYPFIDLLHAIPNGGARHIAVAKKLKAEGVKAGVPDLCLPVARGGYHGLYIEMKDKTGKVSNSQAWWIERLRQNKYRVEVCYSATEAIKVLEDYYAL